MIIEGTYNKKTQYLTYEVNGKEYWAQGEFLTKDTDDGYQIQHQHDDNILVIANIKL